jgi:hypothetical protein
MCVRRVARPILRVAVVVAHDALADLRDQDAYVESIMARPLWYAVVPFKALLDVILEDLFAFKRTRPIHPLLR